MLTKSHLSLIKQDGEVKLFSETAHLVAKQTINVLSELKIKTRGCFFSIKRKEIGLAVPMSRT